MSIRSLSALVAAILVFVIGWSVVLRDRRRRTYVTFAVFCFNVGLWYLAHFFAVASAHPRVAWVSYILATAIAVTSERFFVAFLADDPRRTPPVTRAKVLATLAAYALLGVGLFYPVHRSWFFRVPLFVFVVGALYHCIYLIHVRRRELSATAAGRQQEATRLAYVLYGGAAAVTLAAADFATSLGLPIPTGGSILTAIYLYFISQTLFHYRLLDIKELLGKMVTVSALVVIVAGIYGLLLGWVGADRPGVFVFNTIVASFVVLVLFEPLRSWLEDRVNRALFAEKYGFARLLDQLARDLANVIEARPLVDRIIADLGASERATHASVYLAEPQSGVLRLAGHLGPRPVETLDPTARRLFCERLQRSGLLTLEELEERLASQIETGRDEEAVATRNIIATMEDLKAAVCLPLVTDDRLMGIVTLRDDRIREAYSSGELDRLRAVAAQAAISLRNSRLHERLKERDRLAALGQMAAGLAHEIRNPLGAIKGAAQLLAGDEEGRGDEDREYLDIIVEEVNRLDHVVSQFLGYARPDRGDHRPLNLNDVVRRTVHLLRSQSPGVVIETALGRALPPVSGDASRLHQVFLNLGLNAIQAMEGRGRLRVTTRAAAGGGRVEILFEDSGPGVPERQRSEIFIPFFTTKEGGTGLGLPICQRIVEGHGGRIDVRSAPGGGALFAVSLPAREATAGAGERRQPPATTREAARAPAAAPALTGADPAADDAPSTATVGG